MQIALSELAPDSELARTLLTSLLLPEELELEELESELA